MSTRWLLLGGFALALLVTPYLACSDHQGSADTSHSGAELNAAVLGTWQGSAEIDGETVPFSLVLQQASGKAKPTAVFVVGTLTSENPALNGALDGILNSVDDVDHFQLALRLEDGKTLSGSVEKSALVDGQIYDKAPVGTFSMSRP